MNRKLTEFPDITVRRFSEKTGKELKPYVGPPLEEITKGSRSVRIERTTFDPASRAHLGMRLQAVYGWKPKAFGKDGKPTVDETTLEEIPEAVLPADIRKLILDYFVVSKTLGTLSKGQKAWLTMASGPTKADPWHKLGYIHGQMDTCGAVTRRGTHKNPNLSGCPSVTLEKMPDGSKRPVRGLPGRYGWEMRELFCPDEGHEQTGVDASALELIDLGHYLAPLDKGAFRDRVCDPKRDPHEEHAQIAGMSRADAKTTIYLKIYGGSAYKLSLSLTVGPDEVPKLLAYRGLPRLLDSLAKRFDEDFVRKLDDNQKARISKARQIIVKLEAGITGLPQLIEDVQKAAEKGWLKAIDGSRIHVRKAYAALNSLLQSSGAITCKLWMVLFHREMARRGYVHGVGGDWRQILWVHDEFQVSHKPGLGPVIKEVAEECLVKAGEILNLKGRYRTDGKTGSNWAECH
nr:DNA polymerase [Rhodoblastus acidophilus]